MTPALRFLSAAITTASPDEASGSLFIAGVFLNGGKPRLTPSAAAFDETRGGALTRMIECGAFDAKAGSTLFLGETEAFPNGFAVLGLGEEKDFSRKVFAECAAKAARAFAWAESQAYAVQEWLPPKTSGKSSARLFSTASMRSHPVSRSRRNTMTASAPSASSGSMIGSPTSLCRGWTKEL